MKDTTKQALRGWTWIHPDGKNRFTPQPLQVGGEASSALTYMCTMASLIAQPDYALSGYRNGDGLGYVEVEVRAEEDATMRLLTYVPAEQAQRALKRWVVACVQMAWIAGDPPTHKELIARYVAVCSYLVEPDAYPKEPLDVLVIPDDRWQDELDLLIWHADNILHDNLHDADRFALSLRFGKEFWQAATARLDTELTSITNSSLANAE